MFELVPTRAAVITCVGTPSAVDAAEAVEGYAGRVAPDELMLIVEAGDAARACAALLAAAGASDALVVDVTDGWAVWTLEGEDTDRAMARLSPLELPEAGFAQGDVARVPAKIVRAPGRVHLLVPAMWRAYLRERILERCAGLQVRERAEPADWTRSGGPAQPSAPDGARA